MKQKFIDISIKYRLTCRQAFLFLSIYPSATCLKLEIVEFSAISLDLNLLSQTLRFSLTVLAVHSNNLLDLRLISIEVKRGHCYLSGNKLHQDVELLST